ncbi:unnamed protein product [Lymnaea stagnalis]|uniref:Uncharacterized protein n=1 Tax=Lymnaea stagnalis TaxID=6523 RepID=A0AAV2I5X6_LYMST
MSKAVKETFAQAYYRLSHHNKDVHVCLCKEAASGKSLTSTCKTADDLDKRMKVIVRAVTSDASVAVSLVQSLLHPLSEPLTHQVTIWKDENNLDLLHHAIINKKHELIDHLLSSTSLFPQSYIPPANPYAHLAAMLGYKDCLRVILRHRPNDFFKVTNPHQRMILPEHILRGVKHHLGGRIEAKMNLLLQKIKTLTQSASLLEIAKNTSLSLLLEEDGKTVQRRRRGRLPPLVKPPGSDEETEQKQPVPPVAVRSNRTEQKDRKVKSPPHTKHVQKVPDAVEKKQRTVTPLPIVVEAVKKHMSGQHVITVSWDVLSAENHGVIRGAGFPVKVNFNGDASSSRPGVTLEKIPTSLKSFKRCLSPCYKHDEVRVTCSQLKRTAVVQLKHRYSTASSDSDLSAKAKKVIELGVRGNKKYKSFKPKLEQRMHDSEDSTFSAYNKTPLTLASEFGHLDCVLFILEHTIQKRAPQLNINNPLTLAIQARNPQAVLLLLNSKWSQGDFQCAVLLSIRELYPEGLAALLSEKKKKSGALIGGANLFHLLYTQSLVDLRYEMMPEMTRVLINCKEDVNAHNIPRTYPLYTLICCAFNVVDVKKLVYFIECMKMLLEARANPHFYEEGNQGDFTKTEFSRKGFSSAMNCIFDSAKSSIEYFENRNWSRLLLKKFVATVEKYDQSNRRILKYDLFNYIRIISCTIGVDLSVIKSLLRFGADPDVKESNKYSINVYFDLILPYLTKFEVIDSYDRYLKELSDLMFICHGMSYTCLREALDIFLNEHLLNPPIQALPVCRLFSYLMHNMVKSPRPLTEITSNAIWILLNRNRKRALMLPIPSDLLAYVIP